MLLESSAKTSQQQTATRSEVGRMIAEVIVSLSWIGIAFFIAYKFLLPQLIDQDGDAHVSRHKTNEYEAQGGNL